MYADSFPIAQTGKQFAHTVHRLCVLCVSYAVYYKSLCVPPRTNEYHPHPLYSFHPRSRIACHPAYTLPRIVSVNYPTANTAALQDWMGDKFRWRLVNSRFTWLGWLIHCFFYVLFLSVTIFFFLFYLAIRLFTNTNYPIHFFCIGIIIRNKLQTKVDKISLITFALH